MTAPSARQQLAEVIRFIRQARKLDLIRAANQVEASVEQFAAWEAGTAVPSHRQWERCKHILHAGFKAHEDLWRKARTEEEQVHARQVPPLTGSLTQRPFERLLVLPPVAPPATKDEEPVIPATLLGEGFDLQAAYIAVNKLPSGWNTKLAAAERAAYARELVLQGLTTQEVISRVRDRFNVGISGSTVTTIREELKKEGRFVTPVPASSTEEEREDYARFLLKKSPTLQDKVLNDILRRKFNGEFSDKRIAEIRDAVRTEAREVRRPVAPVSKAINEQDVRAAVELLLEAVPNLARFTVFVDSDGTVKMDFAARETRVGSLTFRK